MDGIQILVVEDHAMQSTLVSFLLPEDGYTVQVAENAEQALEALKSFTPDLIVTDLQLPSMDGLELTRILRLDPVHCAMPIIALTACSDASDLEKAREQAGGIHGISSAIARMESVTQRAAVSIEETASASEEVASHNPIVKKLECMEGASV